MRRDKKLQYPENVINAINEASCLRYFRETYGYKVTLADLIYYSYCLTDRETEVFNYIFKEGMSKAKIGEKLGISTTRITQIENKAARKIYMRSLSRWKRTIS